MPTPRKLEAWHRPLAMSCIAPAARFKRLSYGRLAVERIRDMGERFRNAKTPAKALSRQRELANAMLGEYMSRRPSDGVVLRPSDDAVWWNPAEYVRIAPHAGELGWIEWRKWCNDWTDTIRRVRDTGTTDRSD